MTIVILVEGRTEKEFKPHLIAFLKPRLTGRLPGLDIFVYDGRIPKGEDLRRKVETLLRGRHPHVALHDFEAWLLPFWSEIQKIAGHNRRAPQGLPESVNHNHPPSRRISEIFETGRCRRSYSKPRDAYRILRNQDLGVAAAQCPELKSFLNTIITLSGGSPI